MPRQSMTLNERRACGSRVKNPVEALRASRWWKPTVERFKLYLKTRERLNVNDAQDLFFRFAVEVMSTPESARDSLFAVEEREPYAAFRRYEAYVSPREL